MNMFHNATLVKLRSYHENKYLLAVDDQKSVIQGDNVSTNSDEWTVEFVHGSDSLIRLKSCYGKYLTASDESFLVGFTGFQVHQTLPEDLDSSIEWEPIRVGNQVVKLKNSCHNTFLRANNRSPPWRYSVTHKVPLRNSTNSYEWNLVIVPTTEQPSFSTPQMNANQRVPAPDPAPAPAAASRQMNANQRVPAPAPAPASASRQMNANQRVPAPAPAPASASRQGFMETAKLAVNTAKRIVGAPMGDTTGVNDTRNSATRDGMGISDFLGGMFD